MGEKKELLELLQQTRDEEELFAQQLGADAREIHGSSNAWSPKDELAHIAVWKHITSQYIVAGIDGRIYDFHQDLHQENERIFQRYKHYSWDSVFEIMDLSYKELLGRILDMPVNDLINAGKFHWLDGRSFWQRILHNAVYHPIWHISHLYAKQGESTNACHLITSYTQKLLAIDGSPHGQGHYLYNLACFHALTGCSEDAIDALERAFHLRPELIKWSQQDEDLANLRMEPAYQELSLG